MILIVGGAYQGKKDFARSIATEESDFFFDAQEWILKLMKEGKDPQIEAESYGRDHASSIITLQEMGSGIVPVDPFERDYREQCGRVGCIWAKEATKVYRVVAGIAHRIK